MGCDYFYNGALQDTRLQEQVIDFVKTGYEFDHMVRPQPELKYKTIIGLRDGSGGNPREERAYPFDFFGVIPFCRHGIMEHGQFVFDRTWGGRLVRFVKLPDSFGFSPDDDHSFGPNMEVVIHEGGYHRGPYGPGFALLLNIIRLRWLPDLRLGDEFNSCEDVGNAIGKYGLAARLKDEDLDYRECLELYEDEYMKRHPPRPSPLPEFVEPEVRMVELSTLSTLVADLELTVRSLQCLSNVGIITLDDLLRFSENDLLKVRNLGRKSLKDINDVLQDLGLRLRTPS